MNKNKSGSIVCVIQARVGSARLPGKVLEKVAGKLLIEHVIHRVKQSSLIDEIILATGSGKENALLGQVARREGIRFFAGSENDVLDRFYKALRTQGFNTSSTVIRITGDCPLIDPDVIDQVIKKYRANGCDYVSNVNPPTFPDGLDTEVFSFRALEKAWKEAKQPQDREHITTYIRNSGNFKLENLEHKKDLSAERWTVDQEEDLNLIRRVFSHFSKKKDFRMSDVLELKKNKPEIFQVNQHIARNEGLNKKFIKSKALLGKARNLTPLGAQTFSRSYRYFSQSEAPAFIERGEKAHVWDIDGNEFVDFILSLGAITVGYNNPIVNRAIQDQLKKGVIFSQPSPVSITLAEKLKQIIPSCEMVRFVKNGSDATSAAVRLARAFTGREVIIASGYHGWQDWYIASTPHHKGVPKSIISLSKSCPYNDLEALKKLLKENKGKLAAMIMEPVQSNGPKPGYLKKVKELIHDAGALLIFDEVVSGFRVSLGGAQAYYGVTPDLSSFGKGMANGMPLSCVVGRKDILEQIEQGVFISTTFGDELLSMAASLKTIELLEKNSAIKKMWQFGTQWKVEVSKGIKKNRLDKFVSVSGLAPHCGVEFFSAPGLSYLDLASVFQEKLLEKGILSLGINNFCLSHTDKDLNRFIDASDLGLQGVKKALDAKSVKGILRGAGINPIFRRH